MYTDTQGWTIDPTPDPYHDRYRWVLKREGRYVGDYPTPQAAEQALRILSQERG